MTPGFDRAMPTGSFTFRRSSALVAALLLVFVQLAAFGSAVRGCERASPAAHATHAVMVDADASRDAPAADPVERAAAGACGAAAWLVAAPAATATTATTPLAGALPDDGLRSAQIAPPLLRPPIA